MGRPVSRAALFVDGVFSRFDCVGSGVETRLSGFLGIFGPGWFWHNEYRFADYHNTALSSGPLLTTVSIHPFVQTVRSELTYKFNWSQ
jgi:outer membrane immunogenic protein